MFCSNCGKKVDDGVVFCPYCGAKNDQGAGQSASQEKQDRTVPATQPIVIQQRQITESDLPERFRPLGAWAYFGYTLLFAIPIVGFICLIVFSFSDSNINRRNYARSYWCVFALALIITLIAVAIVAATGGIAYLSRR